MYTHDEEQPKEISRVFYVQDEKRGQECVYAAGWNRKIYIWEDMDEVHCYSRGLSVLHLVTEFNPHGHDISLPCVSHITDWAR